MSGFFKKEKEELPFFTKEEVALHSILEDNWMAIHGKVYNFTGFQNEHPGGKKWITDNAGKDVTRIFQGAHERPNPKKKTQNSRLIGKLVSGPSGVEQKGSFLGKLFSWGKKSEDMAVPQPVKAVETETTTSGQEAGSTTHQFKAAGETVGVPNVQERFTLRIVEAVEDGLPEK